MRLYRVEFLKINNEISTSSSGQLWDTPEDLIITEEQISVVLEMEIGEGIKKLEYVGQTTHIPEQ